MPGAAMTPRQEKFLVGVLGTLLLAGVVIVLITLEAWLFINLGFGWGTAILVAAVALFAGLMNASTPDKEPDMADPGSGTGIVRGDEVGLIRRADGNGG